MAKMPTTDEWVEQIGNKAINEFVYEGRTLKEWIDLMASGKLVVTPDNATNGDVIKALFPNVKIYPSGGYAFPPDKSSVLLEDMSADWWNAPYKVGDTDESDAEFMCRVMSKTVNKSTDDRNFIGGF